MYIFAAKLAYFVELTKEKADYLQFSPFYFCYKNLTTYNAKIFAMVVRKFSILKSVLQMDIEISTCLLNPQPILSKDSANFAEYKIFIIISPRQTFFVHRLTQIFRYQRCFDYHRLFFPRMFFSPQIITD